MSHAKSNYGRHRSHLLQNRCTDCDMIELLTAINNKQGTSNIILSPGVYTKRYDELAKKFREEMVG